MKAPTLAFARLESVASAYVLVLSERPPDEADWASWVAYIAEHISPETAPRVLVVTEGGAPSAAQRASLSRVTERHRHAAKVAVCTDSALARGAITALSWFMPNAYRAFSRGALDDAAHYLDLSAVSLEVAALARTLRRRLDATSTSTERAAGS